MSRPQTAGETRWGLVGPRPGSEVKGERAFVFAGLIPGAGGAGAWWVGRKRDCRQQWELL